MDKTPFVLQYIPHIKNQKREVYRWRHKRLYYKSYKEMIRWRYQRREFSGSAIFAQFQVNPPVLRVNNNHKVGANPKRDLPGKLKLLSSQNVSEYSSTIGHCFNFRDTSMRTQKSPISQEHRSRSVVVQPVVRSTRRARRFPLVQVSRRRPALALTT